MEMLGFIWARDKNEKPTDKNATVDLFNIDKEGYSQIEMHSSRTFPTDIHTILEILWYNSMALDILRQMTHI